MIDVKEQGIVYGDRDEREADHRFLRNVP